MRDLNAFPRVSLGVFPTPVHKLESISRALGTNVYVKRDDLTGLGLGGNKVRKLEFLLADAKQKGAGIVFTTGGAQSNHAMLTAAAMLEAEVTITDDDFTLRDVCGDGYAIPSEAGNAAVRMMAEQEGLFLDPVYTGKAFGGLVAMAREGAFKKDDNVLFLHSGGAGGLFAIE